MRLVDTPWSARRGSVFAVSAAARQDRWRWPVCVAV